MASWTQGVFDIPELVVIAAWFAYCTVVMDYSLYMLNLFLQIRSLLY